MKNFFFIVGIVLGVTVLWMNIRYIEHHPELLNPIRFMGG